MNQRPLPLNTVPSLKSDESDTFIDLNRLTAIALRRSRVVAVCVLLCFLLGGLYLLFATPVYTSQTQILLDENLSKYAEEAPSPQSAQQADTQLSSAVEILKSGELALRVTDAENLGENETVLNPPQSLMSMVKGAVKSVTGLFGSRPEISEAAARNGKRETAAAYIQQGLTVERVARSSVVAVSYKSTDPKLAATITRAYANAYLTDQLNANFDATERASVWLQERLTDLGQRAQAASLEAEKFKAENGLTSTRGELMSEQQLSDLNSQLIVAQADSASASARYNQFQSIIDQGAENAVNNATISSNQTDNSVIQDLRTRYLAVSKREQAVTQNFSADHPQAVSLRAEKTELAGQIFRELQQITGSYRNEMEVAKSREASLRKSIEGVVGKQFAGQPVAGPAARAGTAGDGAEDALRILSRTLRRGRPAALVPDRQGPHHFGCRCSRLALQPEADDGAGAVHRARLHAGRRHCRPAGVSRAVLPAGRRCPFRPWP